MARVYKTFFFSEMKIDIPTINSGFTSPVIRNKFQRKCVTSIIIVKRVPQRPQGEALQERLRGPRYGPREKQLTRGID